MNCCRTECVPAVPVPAARHASSPLAQPTAAKPAKWLRHLAAVIKWAIPLTTLTLLPKCPACVAAYVLLFSGIGLSLPIAAALRWTVLGLSVTVLAYLVLRVVERTVAACRT